MRSSYDWETPAWIVLGAVAVVVIVVTARIIAVLNFACH